ncbi:hypothetical protein OPV22_002036 [Ensete ventricosum]|uniref:Uncharacterized protein n=1 Tax=Ensete ventricosum TaxID=4639 RepID=A0AAV8RWS1_ENSVE|nr:hypothetical protein OPV22_002036 [Ensete ventricosum]
MGACYGHHVIIVDPSLTLLPRAFSLGMVTDSFSSDPLPLLAWEGTEGGLLPLCGLTAGDQRLPGRAPPPPGSLGLVFRAMLVIRMSEATIGQESGPLGLWSNKTESFVNSILATHVQPTNLQLVSLVHRPFCLRTGQPVPPFLLLGEKTPKDLGCIGESVDAYLPTGFLPPTGLADDNSPSSAAAEHPRVVNHLPNMGYRASSSGAVLTPLLSYAANLVINPDTRLNLQSVAQFLVQDDQQKYC